MKQSEFLSSLIRNAYLPKEVPPVVTAKYFADFCEQEASFLEGQLTSLLKISTKYDTFTAPRFGHARRNLAIVHPLGQLAISLLISRNKTKIKKLISKDRTSYYDVKENREKSLAFSGLDFSRWKSESRQLFSEYAYVLKADISRFFYTVYTHSLPWAVLGKEKAKHWHFNKKKSLEKHWSSHLDKALQACQSRETFGIPVGPDTSRVIAEILVSDVAGATGLNDPANGSRMIRLVDDFLIGFHDERSAFKALAKLRNFLWTYNLQLNEVKTGVYASKTQYNESWEHDFETLHISEIDVSQQARDINKILDLTLSIHTHHPSANVINWSCSRLSLVKNNLENFELILEVLLRLGRDFPASLPHVCGFLINNQDICHSKKLVPKIERSLKRLVSFHHQHGHDSEVGWCLLAASVLRVSWDFVELASPDTLPRPAVFAIVGLMHEHGLLNFHLSKWPWKSQLKAAGIMGDHWLPYYESVRRGWTKDKVMINAVKSHPVLSKMLSHDVTFLEDSALMARRIDLKKRVFKKGYSNSLGASKRKRLPFQISIEDYT